MTPSAPDRSKCGVYIHIPFCKSKCNYCAFCSITDMSLREAYVCALKKQISSCVQAPAGTVCNTVYIGGGTPSCLYAGAIKDIFSVLRSVYQIEDGAEITVEVNPDSCTDSFLEECAECGVDRISMGLQSCDNGVLRGIGRVHDVERYLLAHKTAKSHGFCNLSSDMILGLPGQTIQDVARTAELIASGCEHASVYALSVEEGTPLFERGYMPDDDTVAEMYDIACNVMQKHGLSRYEVSNFARPGRQSRHNIKYWECAPYLAFGAAAHGYDGAATRYINPSVVSQYISEPRERAQKLSQKDIYNEYVMLALRTEKGISLSDFAARFGYDFADKNAAVLDMYFRQGCVTIADGFVRISPDRMFVMNGIIEDLMLD